MLKPCMYPVSVVLLFALSSGAISFASPVANEQLWMQATNATRQGIAELQNNINAARTQQAAAAQQNQIMQQRALELLAAQQKAMLENNQQNTNGQVNGSVFNPKPRKTQTNTNPWLKKNPWENTQKNPYSGEQYGNSGVVVQPKDTKNSNESSSKSINIFQ